MFGLLTLGLVISAIYCITTVVRDVRARNYPMVVFGLFAIGGVGVGLVLIVLILTMHI